MDRGEGQLWNIQGCSYSPTSHARVCAHLCMWVQQGQRSPLTSSSYSPPRFLCPLKASRLSLWACATAHAVAMWRSEDSLELVLHSGSWESLPWNSPLKHGLQMLATLPGFLQGAGYLNGPYACMANTLPGGASPRPPGDTLRWKVLTAWASLE